MDRVKKCWLIVLVMCLLSGLVGCSEPQDTTLETQSVNMTETLPAAEETVKETESEETVGETAPEETVEETAPEEVTEPVIIQEPEPVAEHIETGILISLDETNITERLAEAGDYMSNGFHSSQQLTVESEEPFSALYIRWDVHPGTFTLVWDGGSLECGAEGFLHDYIRLPEAVDSISFAFEEEGTHYISEMGLYTYGLAPEGVQDWLAPCEMADILVFPTHADDDVLFFGGAISYYAVEKELAVQTAFMTDHYYEPFRNHERLDGLWEMGVRHYPIVGTARDYYTMSLNEAANYHVNDGVLEWQVQQIRRFKPLVILGHDLEGEYGHGQHKLNAHYLVQAVDLAAQVLQFPMLSREYGIWDTPKLYLHLYEENQIGFDVNTPLENDPEGRNPFAIAQEAYKCHVSQQQYDFAVSQDPDSTMDCTRFGLYRTLVGYDTGSDMMEHTARGE